MAVFLKHEKDFWIKNAVRVTVLCCSLIAFGCSAPEDFSTIPEITFESLEYQEIGVVGTINDEPDSLILEFGFTDGDGNIGINANEEEFPYHEFDLIVDSEGRFVTFGATDVQPPLLRFTPGVGVVSEFSSIDNRPGFSCDDYDFLFINSGKNTVLSKSAEGSLEEDQTEFSRDTLYIVKNPNFNNITINFFIKRSEDNYELVDWKRVFDEQFGCGIDFSSRFPIFDNSSIGSSLEGTIRYKMQSAGFRSILRTDEFRLEFSIRDRAFNESNVVVTRDLTLDDILVN